MSTSIIIELNPDQLSNPDLDIRYLLPDMLAERSGGNLVNDGYDYADDGVNLLLFLSVSEVDAGIACIREVIESERPLSNDLAPAVSVIVERDGSRELVISARSESASGGR